MEKMGFIEFLDKTHEGYIITSFLFPTDPKFFFQDFYRRLSDKGMSHLIHLLFKFGL